MTAVAVAAEIDQLDAISRKRALTEGESRRLEKMLTVQRRYQRPASATKREPVERAGPPYTVAARDGIIARIEAALAQLKRDGRRVRAIYLTAQDMAGATASGRLASGTVLFRKKLVEATVFQGYPVRWTKGRHSVIYDTNGVGLAIRQRVPASG